MAPWTELENVERDGTWAGFSAWESWLRNQMRDDASVGYDEADDYGAWKETLYGMMAGREARISELEAEVQRLRSAIRGAIEQAESEGHHLARGTDIPRPFYETLIAAYFKMDSYNP
jgi:hypothetical protein